MNGTLPPPYTPGSVPNPLARVSVKKCPRGVKTSKVSILFAEAGRPNTLLPLAGLWVEVIISWQE